jgi:hypothetical protein
VKSKWVRLQKFFKKIAKNYGRQKISRAFAMPNFMQVSELDLQIAYRLVWYGSPSDVSTEVNDGRGPADFKIARGAADKTIVEMKLAKNSQLKRNLERQAEIYKAASDAEHAIKVVLFFTAEEEERVANILNELSLTGHKDIVLIEARADNKPSGSKA